MHAFVMMHKAHGDIGICTLSWARLVDQFLDVAKIGLKCHNGETVAYSFISIESAFFPSRASFPNDRIGVVTSWFMLLLFRYLCFEVWMLTYLDLCTLCLGLSQYQSDARSRRTVRPS